MNKPAFVYVTYIKTTAEKVWDALTNGEVTKRYWTDHDNTSDWKEGSPWQHRDGTNATIVDIEGTVITSDRPTCLVVSWSRPGETANAERTSRVTYDIVQDGPLVRLTVTHDDFKQDEAMMKGVSQGWPHVLSSLKSYLETGEPLPALKVRRDGKWATLHFA